MILPDLLDSALARNPNATALYAPSRSLSSYIALRRRITVSAGALPRTTVGKQYKVAVALPNGPEAEVAVFAAASGAVCAAVAPAHGADRSDDEIVDAIETATPSRSFEPCPQCALPPPT